MRKLLAVLAGVLVGLTLASPASAHTDSAYSTAVRGFDFSSSKPTPAQVRAAGGSYVLVYITDGVRQPKHTSPAQVREYLNAGIRVALIYETTASRAKAGCAAGAYDAGRVNRALDVYGLPRSTVVYSGAIDFDAGSMLGVVARYLDCQVPVRGSKDLVGVYGNDKVIDRAAFWGYTRLWQCYAWSGGRWSQAAVIRQVHNGWKVAGRDTDLNYTWKPGYVGFIGDQGTTPAVYSPAVPTQNVPAAAPKTVKPVKTVPAKYVTVRRGDTLAGIAARNGTTWQKVYNLNRSKIRNPNRISRGQVLRVR